MRQQFSTLALLCTSLAQAQYNGGASSSTPSAAATSTGSVVSSSTNSHVVDVGRNGFTFTPDTVVAAIGDQVEFRFYPLSHAVTQSTFTSPCSPSQNGIFSGFFPVASDQSVWMIMKPSFQPQTDIQQESVFTITINDTQPIWLYCAQTLGSHCQSGMAMVINAPSDGSGSLAAYKNAAKNAPTSTHPSQTNGGVIIANPATSNGTTSASGTGSATTSAANMASRERARGWQTLTGSFLGLCFWLALLA